MNFKYPIISKEELVDYLINDSSYTREELNNKSKIELFIIVEDHLYKKYN